MSEVYLDSPEVKAVITTTTAPGKTWAVTAEVQVLVGTRPGWSAGKKHLATQEQAQHSGPGTA